MIRAIALLCSFFLLMNCTPKNLDQPPADLGDFSLGHNVVIATKMQKGPVSRDATQEEWTTNLTSAIDQRLGRNDGDRLYHLGISVEGFMLAPPGVPLIYTPKSALLLNVTVWDDAAGKKINSKPHQLTVFEDTNEDSLVIGSGWGRSKDEQLDGLSYNAAYAIERWLLEQKETLGWFTGGPILDKAPEDSSAFDGN